MLNPLSSRTAPWRTIGSQIEDLSFDESLEVAGIGFTVGVAPLEAMIPVNDYESLGAPLEGKMATYRTDTLTPLGVVGERYSIVQNKDLGGIVEALVGDGWNPVSAGSLRGGAQTFIVGSLPFESKSGEFAANLAVVNSFDGSSAVRFVNTPMRPWCCNAIQMMLRTAKASFSMRHTTRVLDRISEAREALGLATAYYEAFDDEVGQLLATDFGVDDAWSVIDQLIPLQVSPEGIRDAAGNLLSDRAVTGRKNKREAIFSNWRASATLDGVRDTAWGFLNAVNEWEQWGRSAKTEDARAMRNLSSQINPGAGTLTARTHSALVTV